MKRFALLLVLCLGWAYAHPIDEMIQASYLKLEPGGLELELNLTAGELVAPQLLLTIDQNSNKQLEDEELRAYAARVLGQLQLRLDGQAQTLVFKSVNTPKTSVFLAGGGTIQILACATWPAQAGEHRLEFRNLHAPVKSGYLANAFVQSERLQMLQQSRDNNQTQYQLAYRLETDSTGLWWVFAALTAMVVLLGGVWQWRSKSRTQKRL